MPTNVPVTETVSVEAANAAKDGRVLTAHVPWLLVLEIAMVTEPAYVEVANVTPTLLALTAASQDVQRMNMEILAVATESAMNNLETAHATILGRKRTAASSASRTLAEFAMETLAAAWAVISFLIQARSLMRAEFAVETAQAVLDVTMFHTLDWSLMSVGFAMEMDLAAVKINCVTLEPRVLVATRNHQSLESKPVHGVMKLSLAEILQLLKMFAARLKPAQSLTTPRLTFLIATQSTKAVIQRTQLLEEWQVRLSLEERWLVDF